MSHSSAKEARRGRWSDRQALDALAGWLGTPNVTLDAIAELVRGTGREVEVVERFVPDGVNPDPAYCDECGLHIADDGHMPDCSHWEDDEEVAEDDEPTDCLLCERTLPRSSATFSTDGEGPYCSDCAEATGAAGPALALDDQARTDASIAEHEVWLMTEGADHLYPHGAA